MQRNIYHVVWRNERWHLRRARARRSSGTFRTKNIACLYGAFIGADVAIIHGKNGRIQSAYTY